MRKQTASSAVSTASIGRRRKKCKRDESAPGNNFVRGDLIWVFNGAGARRADSPGGKGVIMALGQPRLNGDEVRILRVWIDPGTKRPQGTAADSALKSTHGMGTR